ncbi:MAG: methionine adenosyltransferase [Candidatus Omnitrophica bacterium]|nr:methionine adenosyltransferase [Candidatus Omnitrophota bacterium]
MHKEKIFFTSESVTEGHPDKLCDQVSDSILDEVLKQDPAGRVACETYVTMGLIIVGGEITTSSYIDVHGVTRNTIREIGYDSPKYGFDYKTCAILNAIHAQSPDIAQGVDRGGAGDQGMMIGYACDETDELMPLSIVLAHKLVSRLTHVRKNNILKFLGPDGKSQVTVQYEAGRPVRVDSIVLATQHTETVLDKTGTKMKPSAKAVIIDKVARPVLGRWIDKKTKFFINETGKFLVGGPQSDTGMTGRKIIVDTYGGVVAHGGGAFSGKDPSKVDRSAAYMARYIAKNIVAAKLAKRCLIQLSYCIGRADPLSIMVDTYQTSKISDSKLVSLVRKVFPLTPRGIINCLDLLRPIYKQTAAYGHFGRSASFGFNWERTDKVKELLKELK